ncbi:hypothetical protein [Metabacillus indicus]|uniref:Uncharacterized protein n=1 Tax=Metabacillus indicus TaxID=246786 RepID=A0A084GIK0_METID|nr:hypothetical protein [Metabacillus indicus]KEZ47162.1 hypothetical protein GS18_0220115 [Metabacillus indicus]
MENVFEHNIKLDNHVITKLLEQKDKRALFIYTFTLRWNIERLCVPTQISFILDLLGKQQVSANIKSVRNSLKVLVGMNLVKVYLDVTLKRKAEIDNLNKNDQIFIVAKESPSEENYTLVKADYVDKSMINESELEKEDMVAIVLLLSRNIERKDEVLQVTWHSTEKLAKELKIRKARLFELIDGLKELEVIYFEKLTFEFGEGKKKEHLIYSMFDNSEHVNLAMITAKANGKLDARVKSRNLSVNNESDNNILVPVDVDGELEYDIQSMRDEAIMKAINEVWLGDDFLGYTGIELNRRSARVINEVHNRYGKEILRLALERVGLEGADNPTGYLIKMLPIKVLEIVKEIKEEKSA